MLPIYFVNLLKSTGARPDFGQGQNESPGFDGRQDVAVPSERVVPPHRLSPGQFGLDLLLALGVVPLHRLEALVQVPLADLANRKQGPI